MCLQVDLRYMNTPMPPATILLIKDDPAAGKNFRAVLGASGDSFDLEWVSSLSEGLERLAEGGIAAVLLDLMLPDSQGIQSFNELFAAAPDVPILILSTNEDETIAKQAVGRGAHDYLLPIHMDGYSLTRALRHAIAHTAIEDALFAEKERAIVILNSIGDAVLSTNISGGITYLNMVAEKLTGWSHAEAIGQPLTTVFRILDGSTRRTAPNPVEAAIKQNTTVGLSANCILVRRDGVESSIEDSSAPMRDKVGRVIGGVIVFHDVNAARAMSMQMAYSAQHDVVTNLPNRLLLDDRISQAIALARRNSRSVGVLFLDLDRFKYVNDSYGHAIGDKLLQSVAKRLLAGVRGSDTVSRQGGDEFVILLAEITCPEHAATLAKKLLLLAGAPYSLGGLEVNVTGSIGISVYPGDGEDAETLIKNADTAMYYAKGRGRNNFQCFKTEMTAKAVERQSIEDNLRRALERDEFSLHYQPIVNLGTGKISGAEALIRWRQPDRGLIPPSYFVPIAEKCRLILPIGRWVLGEACRQAREWQEAGLPFMRISVNVSAIEFRREGFVDGVRKILSETGLDARYLALELTEGVLMEDAEAAVSVLQELKRMGVQLAVDDFGTGYSSLSYLQQFPIDVLKIDQSFIHQIPGHSNDSAIVRAIIDMGKNLKQRVIAEGIEKEAQLAFLQTRNCAEGQGYLFSRPLPAGQFAHLLRSGIAEPVLQQMATRTSV